MVTINRCIKALLHPAGGHQGSHKAHQAGNQSKRWCLYIDTASCVHVLCAITQKFCFSISKVYSNLLNYMANGAAIDADYDCKPIALSLYLTVLFLLWVNYHKISNFNRTNPKNQNWRIYDALGVDELIAATGKGTRLPQCQWSNPQWHD